MNTAQDKANTVNWLKERYGDVVVVEVPFGRYVPALNAILGTAIEMFGATHMLSLSTEFPPTTDLLIALDSHMDESALVVGAALAEHEFSVGYVLEAEATKLPWNTASLWNLAKLGLLGFPSSGESWSAPENAGMEEAVTIALYQRLLGADNATAKLVKVNGFGGEWNQTGWSPERLALHLRKLRSKIDRASAQFKKVCVLNAPSVYHIA